MARLGLLIVSAVTLLLSGCQRSDEYSSFIRYHDDGRAKPVVALVPVVDESVHTLPWDVSKELTAGVRSRLSRTGNLYVLPQQLSEQVVETNPDLDLTDEDLSFVQHFSPAEFLVVAELIDHYEVPYERQKIKPVYPTTGKVEQVLMMLVKLRVIDNRGESPKVVLSQLIHSNHMIPFRRQPVDYYSEGWRSDTYKSTPIGAAHARLERDLAAQVEQYIEYAYR